MHIRVLASASNLILWSAVSCRLPLYYIVTSPSIRLSDLGESRILNAVRVCPAPGFPKLYSPHDPPREPITMVTPASKPATKTTDVDLSSGQKLRASCDACNHAKVKCNKTKPVCRRCDNQKLQCIYGLSLRAGKRTAPAVANQGAVQSRPQGPTNDIDAEHISEGSTSDLRSKIGTDGSTPQDDSIRGFLESLMYSEGPNAISDHQVSVFLQDQSRQASTAALSPLQIPHDVSRRIHHAPDWNIRTGQPTEDFSTPSVAPVFGWHLNSHDAGFASTPMQLGLSFASSGRPGNTAIENNKFAFDTPELYHNTNSPMDTHIPSTYSPNSNQAFYVPPSTPTSSLHNSLPLHTRSSCACEASMLSAQDTLLRISDPESITFDTALAANREVLERCSARIECHCFAHDESNAITLSSIMARMISIYWARAGGFNSTSSSTGTESQSFGRDMGNGFEDGKRRPILTVGAYKSDIADEQRLKKEIVLIELSKLRKLVSKFQMGFVKAGYTEGSVDTESSSSVDEKSPVQATKVAFWRSLIDFLMQNLKSVSQDLRSKNQSEGEGYT